MAQSCAGCGTQMDDGTKFCPSCGKPTAVAGPGAPDQGAPGAAQAGLQSNLAAALSYLWIPAIVFLLIEPYNRDKFVRFHAFQALFLGLASFIGQIVLTMIPVIGWVLLPFWSLLIFVLAIVGAVKAYQNQIWSVPVVGPLAQKQV